MKDRTWTILISIVVVVAIILFSLFAYNTSQSRKQARERNHIAICSLARHADNVEVMELYHCIKG